MTQEQLTAGNKLQREIEEAKAHQMEIESILTRNDTVERFKGVGLVLNRYDWNRISLKDHFLPISFADIISMYLKKIDDKIAELEQKLSEV